MCHGFDLLNYTLGYLAGVVSIWMLFICPIKSLNPMLEINKFEMTIEELKHA